MNIRGRRGKIGLRMNYCAGVQRVKVLRVAVGGWFSGDVAFSGSGSWVAGVGGLRFSTGLVALGRQQQIGFETVLVAQDGVSGAHDHVSPQTYQGSSFASHEIEHCGVGNQAGSHPLPSNSQRERCNPPKELELRFCDLITFQLSVHQTGPLWAKRKVLGNEALEQNFNGTDKDVSRFLILQLMLLEIISMHGRLQQW
ncbi:hypothetical protein RHSIM_Rhsim05G0127500 [Rhododendron simsii]|uniref:Uncharacterized protein n=1 Tax=Rhododendron simsii TaxID=118357 RepID=A0A834H0Z4_RHOSS|nr:hypothetical protein RHSIM_Rhsim05G0127500 [Rhododendron simsii]